MLLNALKAIIAWQVMLMLGTNLVGIMVRGLLWRPPAIDAPNEAVAEVIRNESRRMVFSSLLMTLLAALATSAYLFALYRIWNLWLAVAALLPMIARIPNLTWEIRTGAKPGKGSGPSGVLDWGPSVLVWLTLAIALFSFSLGTK